MKAIIGIDGRGDYMPALNLVARLRFEKPEITLVHAVSAVPPFGTFEMVPALPVVPEYLEAAQKAGEEALDGALEATCRLGLNASTLMVTGGAANCLIEEAEKHEADLIAVRATANNPAEAVFLGSVSRGLAISSTCSILVAKDEVAAAGPVTVVFGTDHSDYANKCLDKLIEMDPRGIAKIYVVTAYEVNEEEAAVLYANLPDADVKISLFVAGKLREMSEKVVEKLTMAGFEAEALVLEGNPNQCLKDAMKETGAHLLALGAQGHGLLERLLIGSVSLHQVIAEPYPVMVLRV